MPSNKVLLIGEAGSGKTTFLKKIRHGRFDHRYIATLGASIEIYTRNGVTLEFWDTAGQEKFGGLQDGYYIGGNVAILFIDASRLKLGLREFGNYYQKIVNTCGNIPFIVVINKWDVYHSSHAPYIARLEKFGMPIVKISCKTGENVDLLLETIMSTIALAPLNSLSL